MGCNSSKLDDEEAVQLCKDRKMFIKQAVEHRIRFVSSHAAYIQSLRRVSDALHGYIEGDEPCEVLLDSYMGRSFTPVKKSGPRFITVSPKCFIETPIIQSESKTSVRISYYQPSGNPVISVEERLQSPETVQIQSYSPLLDCSIDGFLTMQPPSLNPGYSPYNRPNIPPPSPQNNQWDFFWDPFSQLDYYGYPTSNLDRSASGLRQVPEGVPVLEEETGHKEIDAIHVREERTESSQNPRKEEVSVVDVDEDKENQANGNKNIELTQESEAQKLEVHPQETSVGKHERTEETPGFTAYANRRPTSMEEVLKDLETQFTNVCDSAKEVFSLLESSHTKHLRSSQEISPLKMLNPVALFRSGSSHFSRFLDSSSGSRDESYESSTGFPAKSCMLYGSHQSTLDRLYAWEKRLYEEVRSAERVRHAYEKKCKQLINRDVEGEDLSFVERTKATIRDLHTQMKVAMHSIKTISMRIETLRDEELRPQLLELLQGLAEMWKVMAECHQTQRRSIDDAKLLLSDGTPSKLSKSRQDGTTPATATDPNRLAYSASILETELRNWRACFESWITSQRSYVHCLSNWLLRCIRCEPANNKPPPLSPKDSVASNAAPPIFGICLHWSKFLDKVSEVAVLDGLEFFAAGMQSVYAQQMRANSQRLQQGGIGSESFGKNVDATGYGGGGREEEAMEAEKMKELATRVLCAGMSAAMSSLADFAMGSAEGYAEVVNQWENVKWPPPPHSGAAVSV